MTVDTIVLVSEADPVANAVATEWGTLPAAEEHVDGVPIRQLREGMLVVRRPGGHIHDDDVDRRLPKRLFEAHPTLVFPSIHRSAKNIHSLTVHALGNPGSRAEKGGRPRTLVPADPLRMVSTLRFLDEGARGIGMTATYEATHHGPTVALPAFFVEIGYGELSSPPREAVHLLADVIPRISALEGDRVALGVGGGHYAPHFTDLALHRQWAFGHILSRHALEELDPAMAREAYAKTPGSEGVLYARAQDAENPALRGVAPRLRDQDAPPRERASPTAATDGARSVSGT